MHPILYIPILLFGLIIGSFLNVCIYRIPKEEDIVKVNSHCMSCGHQLQWYDLFPVFSYVFLKGKCRYCGASISIQYPIVEVVNGLAYCLIFFVKGLSLNSVLYCFLASALLVLSVIDYRTLEIPFGINVVIMCLSCVHLLLNGQKWLELTLGFFAVSVLLEIIYIVTKGAGIGGGDIKLMAVAGLMLGWKLAYIAFFLGCILGSVIHLLRMKFSGESNVLAMGPYLSAGIFITLLIGEPLINWYMGLLAMYNV